MAVQYVGPYSPEVYKIAEQQQQSGQSFVGPYSPNLYEAAAKAKMKNKKS